MKRLYKIIAEPVFTSTRKAGKLSVVHRLVIVSVIIAALTFTFCEDIMEQVKEYNELFEVVSVDPAPASSQIPYTSLITVTFSNDVDMSTVSSSTFKVNNGAVAGTFSYNPLSRQVTFTPDSEFLHSTVYAVDITQGVFSTDGKPLESAYSWSFTTEIYYFNVVSVSPYAGETGVLANTNIVAQFDDNIDNTTLAASILVNGSPAVLAVAPVYDPILRTATFDFSADLPVGSNTITLTTGIKNITGETMAADYTWSFTTIAAIFPEIYILSPIGAEFLTGEVYDFGNQVNPGTTSAVFTIGNSGAVNLNLTSLPLIITGVNSDQFSVSVQPTTPVSVGGTKTVTVVFIPSGATGTKNAILSIPNNDSDENPFVINLTGLALASALPEIQVTDNGAILVSPVSTVDFGTLTIGDTGTKTIVIHNIGTAALDISDTTIGGTNPTLFNTGFSTATIAPGATTNVVITFSAPIKINAKATITFTNNDSDEGSFAVKLKGRTMP